ncbi:hypothetical protein RclHR1_17300004 [Rhizophagus clarus]|uniref:Heat shock protein HSS1 n=1 Tax=Rhizophagus clarus TaxID=94130 RepID=A0A2Z6QYM4_9GLOM|nr:hypothetical protein RclHR1_17300004 [Rhizophagus clarus]GES93343.1 heat shock protein HSS1 [Rhizophagus clarus]
MTEENYAIGIDLGTSYSSVCIWKNDEVKIIENDYGYRTTPSYVAFTDSEILIGDAAKTQINLNPCNTIFDIPRLIGRSIYNKDVQSGMKYWPFSVVEKNEKLHIRVKYKEEWKDFTPEEIASLLIIKMKETAENYLDRQVKNAVITVPAHFDNLQFQAIKNAGLIAGLKIIRIINSPTAAAIAYGLKTKAIGKRIVLVFDLGGSTCNVSLLAFDCGIFEVKAVIGNYDLGGKYFDDSIVNHFVQEIKRKFKKSLSKTDLCRIRTHCERAKCKLSTSDCALIEIDSLLDDYNTTLTRAKFEELNEDLFQSAINLINKVLNDARIDKTEVHEVVLIGGSTHIPRIQKLISKFFDGKELIKSINPEEAAARGAAIQAAILSGNKSKKIRDVLLLDVNAFAFSIETSDGIITSFIERNTTLPIEESKLFKLSTKGSSYKDTLDRNPKNNYNILIQIYEGERYYTNLIGQFELPISSSASKIEITLKLNLNLVLKVSAVEKINGRNSKINKKEITINNGLSEEEIERMVSEAENYRTEREIIIQKMQARTDFEIYIHRLDRIINDINNMNMKNKLEKAISESFTWLDNNEEAEKDEYERKKKLLKETVNQIADETLWRR